MRPHTSSVRSVDFSMDSRYLLTCSDDKTIKLFTVQNRKFVRSFHGHANWVRTAVFSPDGTAIASGSDDKTIRIWDTATGICTNVLYDHTEPITAIRWSADGRTLAGAAADGNIKLWDTKSWKLLQHYAAHTSATCSLSFHPSNNYLISGSLDNTIKIWDLREGHLVYTLHGHTSGVKALTFSADGSQFATGGGDDVVMLWRTNFEAPVVPITASSSSSSSSSSSKSNTTTNIENQDIFVNNLDSSFVSGKSGPGVTSTASSVLTGTGSAPSPLRTKAVVQPPSVPVINTTTVMGSSPVKLNNPTNNHNQYISSSSPLSATRSSPTKNSKFTTVPIITAPMASSPIKINSTSIVNKVDVPVVPLMMNSKTSTSSPMEVPDIHSALFHIMNKLDKINSTVETLSIRMNEAENSIAALVQQRN